MASQKAIQELGEVGGGGGNLRVILVRMCGPLLLNLPNHIYLVFEKNDLFIYLIGQNIYIFILFFDFYIPSLLSVNKVYREINITILVSEQNI